MAGGSARTRAPGRGTPRSARPRPDPAERAAAGGRRLRPAAGRRTRTAAGSPPAPAARANARTLRQTAAGRARRAAARTGSPRRGRRRDRTAPPPQAEQRAAQHGGEAEIVLGQQQGVAQRDQVHDRDLVGERQPVGAGDRYLQLLEVLDQQLLQDAAARQQDHDVAGADRRPAGRQRGARAQPFEDLRRDRLGKLRFAARGRLVLVRQLPALGLGGRLDLDQGPELDQAGRRWSESIRGPASRRR